eukprot:5158484-Ditylum_brightwellii.AAC.1
MTFLGWDSYPPMPLPQSQDNISTEDAPPSYPRENSTIELLLIFMHKTPSKPPYQVPPPQPTSSTQKGPIADKNNDWARQMLPWLYQYMQANMPKKNFLDWPQFEK